MVTKKLSNVKMFHFERCALYVKQRERLDRFLEEYVGSRYEIIRYRQLDEMREERASLYYGQELRFGVSLGEERRLRRAEGETEAGLARLRRVHKSAMVGLMRDQIKEEGSFEDQLDRAVKQADADSAEWEANEAARVQGIRAPTLRG